MKVLHVLGELNPSGAEVMLCSAGPLLKDYSITGEILSTGSQPGPYAQQLERAGYTIRHFPFTKRPIFLLTLFKLLRNNNYDVIHLHTERANFWIGIIALLSAKCCIRTIHSNFPFGGFLGWRRKWQRRLLNRLGVAHIAISQSVRDTEYKHYRLNSKIIFNWYNSLRFTPTTAIQRAAARQQLDIQGDSFVVVSVGNCAPVKNHPALIEAIARLGQQNIVYLHIGIEKDNSEQELAQKFGIRDSIRFKGMQENVLPFLRAADLFVMPSSYEGFSIAVLEAIATGLPALLSKVSGLSDLANFFENLHYCEPTAQSLSENLEKIRSLTRYDLKVKAIENSDKAKRFFGIERGLDAYVACYKKLIL